MKRSNVLMLILLIEITNVVIFMAITERTTWLEAISFITGAACVWLTVTESMWNFPISLVNVSTFCVVFFQAQLFADASLQVVYFVLTAIGWYMWAFGGRNRTKLRITRSSSLEAVLVTLAVIAMTIGLYFALGLLVHFGLPLANGAVSFWDALTTAISLGAQWLLNRKKLENWIFWIIADIIYIPLYINKELYLTAGLYAIFLVMATTGLIQWIRKFQNQPDDAAPEFSFPVEPAEIAK